MNDFIDDFPYRNIIFNDNYILNKYNILKKLFLAHYCTDKKKYYYTNINIPKIYYLFNGKYHYLIYNPKKYKFYMLSDYFNDICRVKCKFGKFESPYNYYNNNKNKIINNMKKNNISITPNNIREQIYQDIIECSNHNPLIIKYFIKKYNAKKILDFSSGWGDRLIGSILSNVDYYYGVDPNKCLHDGYHKIIKLLKPKGEYKLINEGIQDVILPDITFDMIYTSPPYFDYEIYTDDKKQSINLGKNENEWLENFLYPTLIKCIKNIKIGGHIILYFSQEKGKTYIEKWFNWMNKIYNIYYIGNIFYSDIFLKNNHPIFIFQKNKIVPEELYNPEIKSNLIIFDNKKLFIIREDLIIGGSKSRAIFPYLKFIFKNNNNIDELIYLGASNGYAQIALSYSLQLLKSNIKLSIYFQKTNLDESLKISNLAKSLYNNINYINNNKTFKEIWIDIDKYLLENKNTFLIPFGLNDKQYKEYLLNSLNLKLKNYIDKIKRLWLVIGSGILFDVLYKILTKTIFCLVQVGKEVDLNNYDKNRIIFYKSSYNLYQKIKYKIPYPTINSYDGKVWEFKEYFENNDYIWNTAGIHNKL